MDFDPFRYKDASALIFREANERAKGNTMTTTREQIDEYLKEMDESTLLMDGFEDALIGFSQRINDPLLAVYSYDKMVEVLMTRDGMDYDEASEYIDFNCVGAYVGEQTPIIVRSLLM
jgi:hypothetical protein